MSLIFKQIYSGVIDISIRISIISSPSFVSYPRRLSFVEETLSNSATNQ